MKCGNFNFLEPSGPLQACNGTPLPLPYIIVDTLHKGDKYENKLIMIIIIIIILVNI